MGAVQRDTAQFLSGRRDLPYGGIAYVSALCGSSSYSVVGYLLGSFPDPSRPDDDHQPPAVRDRLDEAGEFVGSAHERRHASVPGVEHAPTLAQSGARRSRGASAPSDPTAHVPVGSTLPPSRRWSAVPTRPARQAVMSVR